MFMLFIKRTSSVLSLLLLILMAIGFISPSPKRDATRYYSEYAQRAYNSVVIDNWNKLLDQLKGKDSTDKAAVEFMSKSMIPAAEIWVEKGKEVTAPPIAQKFHESLTQQISQMATESKRFSKAISDEDTETANAAFLKMNTLVQDLQRGLTEFQGMLGKTYGIEFETPKS